MSDEKHRKRRHHRQATRWRLPWPKHSPLLPLAAILLLAASLLWPQWEFLKRRFWTYPRTARVLAALESARIPKIRDDGLSDLRGVFHNHSLLSHDSMGQPEEIVYGAQRARIDFVFLTDHPSSPPHEAPLELRDDHGGVTLVPGVETSQGMIAWFFDTTTVDREAKLGDQIAAVQAAGGLAGVCHPDEPRPWDDLPPFTAMEIYNIHADSKKTNWSLGYRIMENFWSMERYPMLVYHGLVHDPAGYLAIFDRLTATRRITAIAGNDAHQNNGVRLIVSPQETLVLTDTGPYKGKPTIEFTNWLARRYAERHTVGETLWRWDADLYERSFHFVNTHLLATGRTAPELRAAVEAGHAYVAFDSLVTATGFDFQYSLFGDRVTMGGEAEFAPQGILSADTPVEGLLVIKYQGRRVAEQKGSHINYSPAEPGVYRVEAYLNVNGATIPWIYSNPIYLKQP